MTDIEKFLYHAANGAHGAASSGEKTCNALAKALAKIGDDFAVLDYATIEGACEMMRLMSGPWPTDADKTRVFELIENAAKGGVCRTR